MNYTEERQPQNCLVPGGLIIVLIIEKSLVFHMIISGIIYPLCVRRCVRHPSLLGCNIPKPLFPSAARYERFASLLCVRHLVAV